MPNNPSSYHPFRLAVDGYNQRLNEKIASPALRGLPLPNQTLTKALRNLRIGDVTVLGGYEGHGKSALAQQVAFNLGREFSTDPEKPRAVLYCSMEMGADSLIDRVLVQGFGQSMDKLLNPETLAVEEVDYIQNSTLQIAHWPIIIADESAITIQKIRDFVAELKYEYTVRLVVVDYLQLMADPIPYGGSKVDKMDNIVNDLKDLARKQKCHVLALSSLNRAGDDFLPTNLNIRDSQGIAYAADVTMFLTRPWLLNNALGDHWKDHAVLNVQKNRNGPAGMHYLYWDTPTLTFKDADQDVVLRNLSRLPTKRMYS